VVLQASRSLGLMETALPDGVSANVTPWSTETDVPLNVDAFIASLKVAVMTLSTGTPVAPFAGSLLASAGGTVSMT
jgi:hypothetical protein